MPSQAFTVVLQDMLEDANNLMNSHDQIAAHPIVPEPLEALVRAAVVMRISAWESFVEALAKESLNKFSPQATNKFPWSVWKDHVDVLVDNFHTPSPSKVNVLFNSAFGLKNLTQNWSWPGTAVDKASSELGAALTERHRIAHGENPRPTVQYSYARNLPPFIRRLAECTDRAVRAHLVIVLGVANPWPV